MSMVIPPPGPRRKHKHLLPPPRDFGHGTLAQCEECLRWFSRQTIRSGDSGVDFVWDPVRWWNFIERRRIRQSLLDDPDRFG